MRKSKNIILYLPDLLISDLDEYLVLNPPKFIYKIEYFYYIVHYLSEQQLKYKKKQVYRLDLKYLKSVTVSNIMSYVTFLKKGEFIVTDGSYQSGRESLKYVLNEKFIGSVAKIELEKECRLSKRIVKKMTSRKAHYNRFEPFLKSMYKELMKLELDYDKSEEWIRNNASEKQMISYLISINQIRDKRYRYCKRNKTNNRLDTNLTNLKSDLRQFIIGNYVSIDLKNSQPFLLGMLIESIINKRETLCCYLQYEKLTKSFGVKGIKDILLFHQNEEKRKMVNFKPFYDSVLNGVFYDEFTKSHVGEITRNQVKEMMFGVLFSKNHDYSTHNRFVPYESDKKSFESVYPFVYYVIKTLKNRNYKNLSIFLQKFESYLFIDCIAKELEGNGIIPFTIHDSVIVKIEDKEKAIDIINSVFKRELGVIPALDIKNLKEEISQINDGII